MKAFIFASGYGTRNLPSSKTVPKEMFPVLNKTAIDFILEECEQAGITDLIISTSRRKKVLEDYFDRDPELESILLNSGKTKELELIQRPSKFNVSFIRQREVKGTGHALLNAKFLLEDEPFAAFFPDDIVLHHTGGIQQLLQIFKQTKLSILGARLEFENLSAYGVIEYQEKNNFNYITKIVEKPKVKMNSNLVSVGRFIYTPEFLELLEKDFASSYTSGEFYPMGAMTQLANQQKLLVHQLEGKVLDIGNELSYFRTLLEYADQNEATSLILDQFLQNRRK
ncbi:MAG: sugar phosphate nucleotidyltransferase [Brevinemataceae bacterium]